MLELRGLEVLYGKRRILHGINLLLNRGESISIVGESGGGKTTLGLSIMGLVEGTEIELASSAIGGDPLEFRMFGNAISLRREHARHFTVSPVNKGG